MGVTEVPSDGREEYQEAAEVQARINNHREVFVLIGLPGSGKSTVAKMIAEEHDEQVDVHEVSGHVLDQFAEEKGNWEAAGVSDNELGEWAANKKEQYGNGYFARTLAAELNTPQTPHVAISGVRSPAEAIAIEEEFEAASVYTMAVWTMPDIRFERKYGAMPSIEHDEWESFRDRNQRELWDWGAVEFFSRDSVREADYIIPNNGTMDRLREEVQKIIHGKPTDTALNPFPQDDFDAVAQYL